MKLWLRLLLLVWFPFNAWAWSPEGSEASDLLLGGLGMVLGHELGHLSAARNKDVEFDGPAIVYSESTLQPRAKLRIAAAGFGTQWLLSELAFHVLDQPETPRQRDLAAGAILGHLVITGAYLTFLKDDAYGDVTAISEATGYSRSRIAQWLALPAILDAWRLFGDPPQWVPHVTRGAKGWGVGWAWRW